MARLLISHASQDHIEALALRRWLIAAGWSEGDILVDLKHITAESWSVALRKANDACEAVILLASPEALDAKQCQREMNLAEELGKEVVVAILRDFAPGDPRLARYAGRTCVELCAEPADQVEVYEYGEVQRVRFHVPALQAIKTRLIHLGIAPGSFAWTPKPGAGPYPGLAGFTEDDAGIFFGREGHIAATLAQLKQMRRRRAQRVVAIEGASGVGKSSFLRAGLWPRLARDPDFAPLAILRPALGILTGPHGFGRQLAPWFERHGKAKQPEDIHTAVYAGGEAAFAALVKEAAEAGAAAGRPRAALAFPSAPLIAIDQGEELFAAENRSESSRFLRMLAFLLNKLPDNVDPYVLLAVRAEGMGTLRQVFAEIGLPEPKTIVLPPLPAAIYPSLILEPAAVYSTLVRQLAVEPALVEALAGEAKSADGLPCLAFALEQLFRADGAMGALTLKRYKTIGAGGAIDTALAQARLKAGAEDGAERLRRLVVRSLATWEPSAQAPRRLVAKEDELAQALGCANAPLVDALVDARLLTRNRDTLEVAHEAVLRRPFLSGWLEAYRDGSKLCTDVLAEAAKWQAVGSPLSALTRRGKDLKAALALLADPDFGTEVAPARDYLAACRKAARVRSLRMGIAGGALAVGATLVLVGFTESDPIRQEWRRIAIDGPYIAANVAPYLLSPEQERALKAGDTFRECARACPEMVVVPAGTFVMGSPDGNTPVIGLDGKPKWGPLAAKEDGRREDEGPQHEVRIERAFAVGRFAVTFEEWDECTAQGGCPQVSDIGWGRGRRPIVNVSWPEAKAYVAWLSRVTGETYRLLSEAEWEYAARAGAATAFNFGENFPPSASICAYANFADVSLKKAAPQYRTFEICDDHQAVAAPVGSYEPNAFGLYDMHGNVLQWTADCYVKSYSGAPTDGSAAEAQNCGLRAVRGGAWNLTPQHLRSAARAAAAPDDRNNFRGFRVARTLQR